MPIDFENDQTTQDAMAKLMEAEAHEPVPFKEAFVQSDSSASVNADADGSKEVDKTPSNSPSDTPAGTKDEPAPKQETKPEPVKEEPKPDAKAASKFAADKQRKDDSWKALNTEKEAFKNERAQFEQQKQALQAERDKLAQEKAKSSRKFSPEQYEQAAAQKQSLIKSYVEQAELWDTKAEKLEADGDFKGAANAKAKADELRESAAYEKGVAKQYQQYAEHIRKNPEPTLEQIKTKNNQALQHYTLEAAKQWPELAKEGSELQKLAVKNIQEARAAGLDENEFPVIRYHAARLAALELVSASVSELQKKLGAAEAKVKELEAFTAPGGGGKGSVQTNQQPKGWDDLSPEEQESSLRQSAAQMS